MFAEAIMGLREVTIQNNNAPHSLFIRECGGGLGGDVVYFGEKPMRSILDLQGSGLG